jgi:uncharacterized membrane protein YhaH (DUF805 family)
MSFAQLLFSFRGRIGRTPWWLTSLAMLVVMPAVIFAIFAVLVLADAKSPLGSGGPGAFVSAVLYVMLGAMNRAAYDPAVFLASPGLFFTAVSILLIMIGGAWIGLALGAKRLHDRNKSAWWLLLFWLMPQALHAVGERMEGSGLILALTAYAILIWALVELGFLPGTAGPNRYGASARDGARARIEAGARRL